MRTCCELTGHLKDWGRWGSGGSQHGPCWLGTKDLEEISITLLYPGRGKRNTYSARWWRRLNENVFGSGQLPQQWLHIPKQLYTHLWIGVGVRKTAKQGLQHFFVSGLAQSPWPGLWTSLCCAPSLQWRCYVVGLRPVPSSSSLSLHLITSPLQLSAWKRVVCKSTVVRRGNEMQMELNRLCHGTSLETKNWLFASFQVNQ